MYLGIDIGGTKTLLTAFSDSGEKAASVRFPTPEKYADFLDELGKMLADLPFNDFWAGCIAAPGALDRNRGEFLHGGNLKWEDEPLQHDVERLTHCPMLIENDANLGGLSEALLVSDHYKTVLYLTISTGIGTGFITNGAIDPSMADSEGGQLLLQRGDKLVKWESFASGKAVRKRYGKQASDITDAVTWQAIAKDLAIGIIDLLAVTQPDVIVIGGGMGHYLERFHKPLLAELDHYATPMVPVPPVIAAQRPDDAVIYGCFALAQERYA